MSPGLLAERADEDDKDQPVIQKQLYKGLNSLTNFAIGVTYVAIVPCILYTYDISLIMGGPVILFWGFVAAILFTIVVALCLAELCAAYPSTGCVYYWAGQLCPIEDAPKWSYLCGVLFFLGMLFSSAGWAFATVTFINATLAIHGVTNGPLSTVYQTVFSCLLVIVWSLLSCLRVDHIGWLNTVAAGVYLSATIVLCICLFVMPKTLNTPAFVCTDFYNGTGFPEWYVVFLGVGAIAYAFNGYDCSGRMSEETSSDEFEESKVAPARSIVHTVMASSALGMLVVVALLFATTNIPDALSGSTAINSGNSAVNVIVTACGDDVAAAIAWSFLFVIFISGVSCATGASRVCFALARDQMLPLSELLAEIDDYTQCPVNVVFFNGVISILICLLALTPVDKNAFYCIIGMSTSCSSLSYATPMLERLIYNLKDFPVTKLSLGEFSYPLYIISCIWLFGVVTCFLLPTNYPVTIKNMNWLFIVLIVSFTIGILNWFFNAQFHFKGPLRYIEVLSPDEKERLLKGA